MSVLEAYLAQTAGRDDPEVVDAIRRQIEALKWAGSRALFTLTSPPEHTEVKLSYLMMDSKVIRGFALPVSFNGGKTMRLIGDVSFNNCPIGVSDKKFLADEDGLIGTDIFSMFLVTIDIQKMVLKLDPLPKHKTTAADPNWQDREAAPEFSSYTSFWRVGHTILLSTRVSGARPVLFVIDTASSSSLIDPIYARQLTGVRSEDLVNVKGVSGKVKKVESAGQLTFEFGHYRQPVPGMLAIPLAAVSRDSPQITGIFGITTLASFRLQINYRDGLINLDYTGPKY